MSVWRPPSIVRPIAIGIVRRGDELLLMVVRSDDGAIKGYRPLGGSIEFGERAADALKREFTEELGLAITEPAPLTVLENLYTHHGAPGHEIVFVFEAAFVDESAHRSEGFSYDDGGVRNDVAWVALARFRAGEAELFPTGLLSSWWESIVEPPASTRHPEVTASSAFTRVFDAVWRPSKDGRPRCCNSGAVVHRGSQDGGSGIVPRGR